VSEAEADEFWRQFNIQPPESVLNAIFDVNIILWFSSHKISLGWFYKDSCEEAGCKSNHFTSLHVFLWLITISQLSLSLFKFIIRVFDVSLSHYCSSFVVN